MNHPAPASLIESIQTILASKPGGLSEYDLLSQLARKLDYFVINHSEHLELFQRHFLLFHCLYQLQQDLYRKQTGIVQISPLEIRLWPYRAGELKLAACDPVRDYYLDITNLNSTSSAQVDDLLGKFWLALANNDSRADALNVLDLVDPVEDTQIRRRYKEQVMQHHPDRGGDNKRLQQLNIAISQLLPKAR